MDTTPTDFTVTIPLPGGMLEDDTLARAIHETQARFLTRIMQQAAASLTASMSHAGPNTRAWEDLNRIETLLSDAVAQLGDVADDVVTARVHDARRLHQVRKALDIPTVTRAGN